MAICEKSEAAPSAKNLSRISSSFTANSKDGLPKQESADPRRARKRRGRTSSSPYEYSKKAAVSGHAKHIADCIRVKYRRLVNKQCKDRVASNSEDGDHIECYEHKEPHTKRVASTTCVKKRTILSAKRRIKNYAKSKVYQKIPPPTNLADFLSPCATSEYAFQEYKECEVFADFREGIGDFLFPSSLDDTQNFQDEFNVTESKCPLDISGISEESQSFVKDLHQIDLSSVVFDRHDDGSPLVIGRGVTSAVHVGVWRDTKVAVKVYQVDDTPYRQLAEKIISEARAMKALEGSKYFANLIGVATNCSGCGPQDVKVVGLVQEFIGSVDGCGHAQIMSAFSSLTDHDLGEGLMDKHGDSIVAQILKGVSQLHAAGLVHNDLHLANVLLRPVRGFSGQYDAVIIDLGICTPMGAPSACIGGDPDSITAPELRKPGGTYTVATDMYMIGYMLKVIGANTNDSWMAYIGEFCHAYLPRMRPKSIEELANKLGNNIRDTYFTL